MLWRGETKPLPEEMLYRSSWAHLLGLIKFLFLKALPREGNLKVHVLEVGLGECFVGPE